MPATKTHRIKTSRDLLSAKRCKTKREAVAVQKEIAEAPWFRDNWNIYKVPTAKVFKFVVATYMQWLNYR